MGPGILPITHKKATTEKTNKNLLKNSPKRHSNVRSQKQPRYISAFSLAWKNWDRKGKGWGAVVREAQQS